MTEPSLHRGPPPAATEHTRNGQPAPPAAEAIPSRRPGLTPVTLLLTLLVAYVLYNAQLVVILALLALVFATLIERPVQLLERRHVPRAAGILIVYISVIASLTFAFLLLAPTIQGQAAAFRAQAPESLRTLQGAWQDSANGLLRGPGQELLGRAIALADNPGAVSLPLPSDLAVDFLAGIGGGVLSFLTVFVIAFYYLMEKSWLRRLIIFELAPESRTRVGRIWDSVEGKVGDWLRGQLVLCLLIGTVATIGYGLLGVNFWPLLGVWAGLTEIIPILGPWLGGIPAVTIALTQSWDKALLVTGFVVMLQLTENMVLVPRVMRGAVGLSPLTVFLAILAIPVAAAVQVVLTEFFDARKEARRSEAAPLPGWRWMRGSAGGTPGTGDAAPPPVGGAPPLPTPAVTAASHASAADPSPRPRAGGWTADVLARMGKGTPGE